MSHSWNEDRLQEVLAWSSDLLGLCTVLSEDRRIHERTAVHRLRTVSGYCYLKVHRDRSWWEREVYGYEQWAEAFGGRAPNLIAVREEQPNALIVSELPGRTAVDLTLAPVQEERLWYAAGQALRPFHEQAEGDYFGPARRDGSPVQGCSSSAVDYVAQAFARLRDKGVRSSWLSREELAVIDAAYDMRGEFCGERPVPCHRDYGPDNWLVGESGAWSGVIDFEFSCWDVRLNDFSRYPNWEWIQKSHLLEALFAGYGRPLSPREEKQLLVLRTRYALDAIIWGRENEFYGFEQEGREALKQIVPLL